MVLASEQWIQIMNGHTWTFGTMFHGINNVSTSSLLHWSLISILSHVIIISNRHYVILEDSVTYSHQLMGGNNSYNHHITSSAGHHSHIIIIAVIKYTSEYHQYARIMKYQATSWTSSFLPLHQYVISSASTGISRQTLPVTYGNTYFSLSTQFCNHHNNNTMSLSHISVNKYQASRRSSNHILSCRLSSASSPMASISIIQ